MRTGIPQGYEGGPCAAPPAIAESCLKGAYACRIRSAKSHRIGLEGYIDDIKPFASGCSIVVGLQR